MGAMNDFYLRVAWEAGMDPDDEATCVAVTNAVASARRDAPLIDVFDHAVDELLVSRGMMSSESESA